MVLTNRLALLNIGSLSNRIFSMSIDIDSQAQTFRAAPRPDPKAHLPDLNQPLSAQDIALLLAEMAYPEKALFVLETWCVKKPEKSEKRSQKEAKGAWNIAVKAVLWHAMHTVIEAAEGISRPDVIEQLGGYIQQFANQIVLEMKRCITRNAAKKLLDGTLQWSNELRGDDNFPMALSLEMFMDFWSATQKYLRSADAPPSTSVQMFYRGIVDRMFELYLETISSWNKFTAREQKILSYLEKLMEEIKKYPSLPGHEEIIKKLQGLSTL